MVVEPLPDDVLRGALGGRRILFVLGGLERGGAEVQALLLAEELRGRYGARVEFLGLGPGRAVETRCRELGIPVRWMTFRAHSGRATRAWDYFRAALAIGARRPAIVAPYTIVPNVVACSVRALVGRPFCVWNQRDEGCFRLGPKIERFAVRRASAFVALSARAAEFLADELRASRTKTFVVYNGVRLSPPKEGRDAWRRRCGAGDADCVVSMVANFHPPKDHAALVRAFRLACDSVGAGAGRPRLVFAGRADHDPAPLRELASSLGLEGQVAFLGETDDVAGLLAASDVAALSSLSEGLSSATLEAMAAGLPFVGADLPALREALGADAADCLAPPGDAVALAARLAAFIAAPELRAQWGRRNRLRAETEFSVDKMVRSMASILAAGALRGAPGSRGTRE